MVLQRPEITSTHCGRWAGRERIYYGISILPILDPFPAWKPTLCHKDTVKGFEWPKLFLYGISELASHPNQSMRAQYLDDSGPMGELHSVPWTELSM